MSEALYPGQGISREEYLALQAQLHDLEERLAFAAPANAFGANLQLPTGITPPPVSGITVVPGIGTITVAWNPSPIADVRYYEIQVSTSSDFTGASTYRETRTRFVYDEGSADIAYFIRVRVVNLGGDFGGWSATINSLTGVATTGDLAPQAATNPVAWRTTSFSPVDIVSTGVPAGALWGAAPIDLKGGLVLVFPSLICEVETNYAGAGLSLITTQIFVDGAPSGDAIEYDVNSTLSTSRSVLTLPTDPVDGQLLTPIVGTHLFSVAVAVEADPANYIRITPARLKFTLVELRR